MRDGYRFESTLTLDGEVETTVSGLAGRGGTHSLVETGSAEIEYLITPQGRWAREPGGDWLVLASDEDPLADPLAPLEDPLSVVVLDRDGDGLTLEADYPAEALGIEGNDAVTVELLVIDGRISTVSYAAEAGGKSAKVQTSFSDIGSAPPVTAPDG